MDEELVEVREPAHPIQSEESRRRSRSDRRDERGVVLQRDGSSSPFGKTTPHTGKDQPGAREKVVLTDHEMRGQIAGRPRPEQRRRLGTEPRQQRAEPCSLIAVEELANHVVRLEDSSGCVQ